MFKHSSRELGGVIDDYLKQTEEEIKKWQQEQKPPEVSKGERNDDKRTA